MYFDREIEGNNFRKLFFSILLTSVFVASRVVEKMTAGATDKKTVGVRLPINYSQPDEI